MQEKEEIKTKKGRQVSFIKRTMLLFFILFFLFAGFNLAPLSIKEVTNVFFSLFIHDERTAVIVNIPEEHTGISRTGEYTEPTRIAVARVGLDAKILNPESREVSKLDQALLFGAVRYPGSGDLESTQNIFIFGHSSFLPVVHNENFKVFNRLKDLKGGDIISLFSNKKEYRYKVKEVKLTTAEAQFVDLSAKNHELILSTCNSFGQKQERYVVTATFFESVVLSDKGV